MPNPEDKYPAESPEWWLHRLARRLDDKQAGLDKLQDYYDGRHPLAFASPKFRESFGGLFRAFADNFCPLVVDAVEERLNVEGFRLGTAETGSALPGAGRSTKSQELQTADQDAWRIWQANQMDAESQKAHTTALTLRESFVIVWANPDDADTPSMTVETPREVIVALDAGNRRKRLAALKRWVGDDGYAYATVFLPDNLWKYRSAQPYRSGSNVQWEDRAVEGEPSPLPNPLGVVPVIPLVNRPRLDRTGESEHEQVIPAQDAINKLAADMLVASEFAAFRQRYALNLEVATDPDTGRPIEPFRMGVDRLLVVPPPEDPQPGDPQVQLGEFEVSDLRPYVSAIELWVQHIATRTRTPAHYLLGQSGAFPSGESLKATETGLVAKVKRAQRHFGEAWEEVMRTAFLVLGDKERGTVQDSETIWADPESRTESEHVDAISKMAALGVPQVALWEELGFSPQQIARFQALREAEALEAGAAFDPFRGLGNGQGAGLGVQAQPAAQPPGQAPAGPPPNGGAPVAVPRPPGQQRPS